jgi:diacylglycerol kinase (ATP)
METAPSAAQPVVILNPAAHRGKMRRYRRLIHHQMDKTPGEYVETKQRGDARELAYKAAEEGRPVVMIGGDGTVNEVVNGLLSAGRQVPLGIVPAGSGNDFAYNTLKIPRDRAVAIERAFTGDVISADAGIVNDRFFANSFSIGLDADIAAAAEGMKRLPFMTGLLLYYTSTLRQLLFGYGHCPWLTFTIDGQSVAGEQQSRYVLLAITNGPTYGSGFRINPRADHTDGRFDICAIRYTPLLRALRLLPIVQKGQHEGLKEIAFYHGQTLHIECPRGVNGQLDGETMHASVFDVRLLPGALHVRV